MEYNNIPWNEIIKKEARGIDDADFGEIQSVDPDYVITQKDIIVKEIFSFPINLVQEYDGNRVIFEVTEEEARNSYMKSYKIDLEQDYHSKRKTETTTADTIITNDESLTNTNEEKELKINLIDLFLKLKSNISTPKYMKDAVPSLTDMQFRWIEDYH